MLKKRYSILVKVTFKEKPDSSFEVSELSEAMVESIDYVTLLVKLNIFLDEAIFDLLKYIALGE